MKRPIIGKERYEKLKKLMQGTAEDVKLVVNIVNECDMDKSLLYILALISQKYEGLATFATPLTNGKNTYKYLCKKAMTTLPTLDTLVGVWQVHCEENGISHTQGQKFLASEYPPIVKRLRKDVYTLNPKKKRL